MFPPAFAPRMGYLCKLLSNEYEITVLTEKSEASLWSIDITRNKFHLYEIIITPSTDGVGGKLCHFKSQFLSYAFNNKDKILYREALKLIGGNKYDIVLCSSYYIFPLLSGYKLARYFNAPLCVDLRDIVEQYEKPRRLKKLTFALKLRWLNVIRRDKILRKAQAITSVSEWHRDFLKQYCYNSYVIYNGYDADVFYPQSKPTEKFTISYTGRLLSLGMRNPSLLFEAVDAIYAEQNEIYRDLVLEFLMDTESQQMLANKSSQYEHVGDVLKLRPMVKMAEIPSILNQSSIVLILTNKATPYGPHGIMTTKFFEALGVEKPILCVKSDEDCLAHAIAETNAGIAATNVEEVKQFIVEKYSQWKRDGFTRQLVNIESKLKYSRQAEAKQFAELFRQIVDNK